MQNKYLLKNLLLYVLAAISILCNDQWQKDQVLRQPILINSQIVDSNTIDTNTLYLSTQYFLNALEAFLLSIQLI